MTGRDLAIALLCLVGWGWSIRAGAAAVKYQATKHANRIAIGHSLVALLPLAIATYLAW